MADPSLDELRERIRQIDLQLVACAAERVELARQVGEIKRREKRSMADYAQERAVLERARDVARERGLEPGAAVDLIAGLIRASVTAQDEDSLRVAAVDEATSGEWKCREHARGPPG